MPRNMSFSLTTDQIRNRTKDVTRRLGWRGLMKGQKFWACVKCMGLKPGEKVERLALLECVSNTREMLYKITAEDVRREGFPGMSPGEFMAMFCKHMDATARTIVHRIEFKYVDPV